MSEFVESAGNGPKRFAVQIVESQTGIFVSHWEARTALDAKDVEIAQLRKVVEAARLVNRSRQACILARQLFYDPNIYGNHEQGVSYNYAWTNHQVIHAILLDRLHTALAELDGGNNG